MKSELFKNSYCVFVDQAHSKHYKKELEKENLIEKGIGILNAKVNSNLSCIVIPNHLNYNLIVAKLWNNRKDGGFWHQWGMGYAGKEWETCT